ncbi:MAG: 30S ribosomal protein S3 [Candidatus Buchananbacteria bacterium RIFCSPHIGHO2_01_FULL_39_14]|uniref:Small ribosomal subunit protein uS3 n=2 Tax=Candidatus Buchananiibacteriota TaxID=1817903 RepID=A0A1G1YPF5_9BACT|nr:MAG: 30S ribosomal protein S3 [Candidatus Buchananbacteria bacterium RIFCSPHIGHO2_01_FULL_39_14]OGY49333.1 MAG: 30S ribosomal protein S3 [Candidatus Buchananbacteria bacterium RIFCSPHIGHO2_02_FULL_39_17]OGY53327.1 MAG: 30S ribosomal protein S3 [Candidatus Buchananbacteria bacterium RIFCSPLOWO2_01_FULL_40_23b]
MGQKVHPKIFRMGVIYSWDSKWFSRREFPKFLKQDVLIRKFLKKELKDASVSQIEIERSPAAVTIIIHSAKPGVIIGRGGQGIEELKKKIKKQLLEPKTTLNINIKEVTNPNLSAELVLQSMIADLEKRVPYRRILKQAIGKVSKTDAKGIKVNISGRLNGAEIAREESLSSGNLPLHTLRADIDYARGVAHTTYGTIGVKVWIYKGEIFKKENETKVNKK